MSLPLQTERLTIRSFTQDDLAGLHRVFGDPDAMQFIPSGASPTLERTQKILDYFIAGEKKNGFGLWAVIERASGEFLGDCGLFPVEGKGPDIEIAYHFAKAAWGMGFATEAARACLAYGFDELKLARIVGMTYPEHRASQRVLEKIGLTFEGVKHHYGRDMTFYAAAR